MSPPLHVQQTYLPQLHLNGLRTSRMVAALHRSIVTESAKPDLLQNTAHLLIRNFAEDLLTPLLKPHQELPTASLFSGPTSIRALVVTWGHLLPTGGLLL